MSGKTSHIGWTIDNVTDLFVLKKRDSGADIAMYYQ